MKQTINGKRPSAEGKLYYMIPFDGLVTEVPRLCMIRDTGVYDSANPENTESIYAAFFVFTGDGDVTVKAPNLPINAGSVFSAKGVRFT